MAILKIAEQAGGCLEQYLTNQGHAIAKRLPAGLARTQKIAFEERLENLTDQINEFLKGNEKAISFLVLGKVQSGKTGHLIGSLSFAAASKISFASVFTGINDALNTQTLRRVERDLGRDCVVPFIVPTSTTSRDFDGLFLDVKALIASRNDDGIADFGLPTPMPVFITMKNRARISTLGVLIEKLVTEFGSELTHLIIDDEADQASQNAKAKKQEQAATYKALGDLRDGGGRHVLLSYTATPQAVLLAERQGRLRPDYCVTVPPRAGYFGLSEISEPSFDANLIEVDDVLLGRAGNPSTWNAAPDSLRYALVDFYLAGLIRREWPQNFYRKAPIPFDQMNSPLASTQMLIHQSVNVREHSAIYRHVKSVLSELKAGVFESLTNGVKPDLMNRRWEKLVARSFEGEIALPASLEEAHLRSLYKLLANTAVKIVNGDANNETAHLQLPSEDSDWESKESWILIGGEILGRGLTIPQLTTTYFLRSAKVSNFDTISQQMRFCGYRMPYSHLVTLHAPKDTFDKFRYMNQIESVVWRFASRWDSNRNEISKNIPPILFVAPVSANLEPTRKNVRDPYLIDQRIDKQKQILKSLTHVFNPTDVYDNLRTLQNWALAMGTGQAPVFSDGWAKYSDVMAADLKQLLGAWSSGESGIDPLRAISELFTPEMGEIGLAGVPITVLVRGGLLQKGTLSKPLDYFSSGETIERAVNTEPGVAGLGTWEEHFQSEGNALKWPTLKTPHTGDSQRRLVKSIKHSSTVIIIEPVVGHAHNNAASKVGYGLALTIYKPEEYEVRLMGHA